MTGPGSTARASAWAVVGAVLAWLVVVALGSTLVWAVISRAGEGVVSGNGPATAGALPGPPASSGTRTASGPSSEHSSSPGTTPSDTGAPTSSSGPATDQPSGTPGRPAVEAERRTWQGTGGLVIAECTGPSIRLVATAPDDGFKVEVEARGPGTLKVRFERTGEQGGETVVTGVCGDGSPVLTGDTRSDD